MYATKFPDRLPIARFPFAIYKPNETVFYECNRHYQFRSGSGDLRCLLNGTWDMPLPQCIPIKDLGTVMCIV